MTPKQATEIFRSYGCWPGMPNDHCERWLETFVSLGILKLDGPKSIEDRIKDCCHDENTIISRVEFIRRLDSVGLKIVEK